MLKSYRFYNTKKYSLFFNGAVSQSLRYCNAKSTRDRASASTKNSNPVQNEFNIEEDTWSSYQILS